MSTSQPKTEPQAEPQPPSLDAGAVLAKMRDRIGMLAQEASSYEVLIADGNAKIANLEARIADLEQQLAERPPAKS